MNIKILGPGCPNCHKFEKNVRDAVEELNVQAEISKVEDIMDIMEYNIIRTPGLVIDDNVVSYGRVLTVKQIKKILTTNP